METVLAISDHGWDTIGQVAGTFLVVAMIVLVTYFVTR